ncbi:hypothetical protein O3P69_009356 [Scylla paramamosain]|uniref:Equilibrative nucleoside transporter 3 n=3 Tax=Scylla paramamosain TaxID=85552 RepID=A0AAW0TB24_SCYPA
MEKSTAGKVPFAVTLVFYMLGNAILLPWNFCITAETYWRYKLRNTTLNDSNYAHSYQDDGGDDGETSLTQTPLQASFMPTFVLVSNVFSTAFFFVTSFIVKRISEEVRIYGSIGASFIIMLLITILTFVDTDSWQEEFYVITIISSAILSMCMAITQGSASGLAGLFPPSCMATLMSGQALAGVISSLARIVSLLVYEEPIVSGFIFFSISDVFLISTLLFYLYLRNMNYYKNIKNDIALINKNEVTDRDDTDEDGEREARKMQLKDSMWTTYFIVFRKIWTMGMTVCLTLFITLAVFPNIVIYITSTLPESRWTEVFFQPTITFLLFNVGDVVGREITRWLRWPGPKGWALHLLGAARIIFVPLLMLCHGEEKSFPTIFYHDAYYIVINLLFSISNGYIITLTFIYYQTLVNDDELEMGGAIMVAMVGVGLVAGSLISPALVVLWTSV